MKQIECTYFEEQSHMQCVIVFTVLVCCHSQCSSVAYGVLIGTGGKYEVILA